MRIKGIVISAVVFLLLFSVFLMPQETPDVQLDIRKVNDILKTLSEHWEETKAEGSILPFENEMDYAVITSDGNLVAATRRGLNEKINDAVRNRDTIVDVMVDGEIVGKVIFHNDTARIIEQNRINLRGTAVVIAVILFLVLAGYALYLHTALLRPFKKMQGFARHIAAGNLDIPLEMDRNNLFGAFTESFDVMREELHKAREKEREADRSKKEIIASISHDIKTPVASIKSAVELMLFTTDNEEYREQLEGIDAKAEQINSLITNMFHSTLEELGALNVSVAEIQSAAIQGLIRQADYEKRAKPFELPNCLVLADPLRLQQVFDNIISNSYKYAGTDIEVGAFFDERVLVIDIADFGAGIPDDEFPLILNKFHRGKNAADKSGYGLGLYICKHLMEQMSGDIRCKNRPGGFCVRLSLRLA